MIYSFMHRALRPGGDVLGLAALHACGGPIDAVDERGRTALYYAAQAGYDDAVVWLLEHGADASRVGDDGRNALHAAAAAGHVQMCELLVSSLDDQTAVRAMQAVDAHGRNPAEVAAASQHLYVVRVLLMEHARCVRGRGRAPAASAEAIDRGASRQAAGGPLRTPKADNKLIHRERGFAPPLSELEHPPEAVELVKTP